MTTEQSRGIEPDQPRRSPEGRNANPAALSRREALLRGAATVAGMAGGAWFLAGCASGGATTARKLPSPLWPDLADATPAPPPRHAMPHRPRPSPGMPIIERSAWAGGAPNPIFMARMQPIQRITLHHDGMSPFTATAMDAARDRIEAIRMAHVSHPGWGDIGYHFVIDPAGRVWEARPVAWQGAHVGGQNQGNLGICVLGNYEQQYPNDAQLAAVRNFVTMQMQRYGVGVEQVYTHKELAPTLCPGRHLQPRLVAMRSASGALAMV